MPSTPPGSHPVLELPGPELDLPRRQIDQPPLLHAIRRPVRQTPLFLGLGFDDTFDLAPPILLRPVRNKVDEFRLVGHGTLLATRAGERGVCASVLNDPLPKPVEIDACSALLFTRQTTATPSR